MQEIATSLNNNRAREPDTCFICQIHNLRHTQEKMFVLDIIKHNKEYTCQCKRTLNYHPKCFERWRTFFKGTCPQCLCYKSAPSDKVDVASKCCICKTRNLENPKDQKAMKLLIDATFEVKDDKTVKCECGPFMIHALCGKKWYESFAECPKCLFPTGKNE